MPALPDSAAILAALARIASEADELAVVWHVVFGLAAAAISLGSRPKPSSCAAFLTLLIASVSATAWVFGNPFNGAILALGALALGLSGLRGAKGRLRWGEDWAVVLGASLLLFGTVYPHFPVGSSPLAYLYAAPLGTLPCPTLGFVAGATLIGNGLMRGAWPLVLASLSAFYAGFGALRLGVELDFLLMAAPAGLLLQHHRRLDSQ
jgi:hypothetical protein